MNTSTTSKQRLNQLLADQALGEDASEDDEKDLARLLADRFEGKGWRTIFLGANMPANDLVMGVKEFSPRMVALSVRQALNLRSAAETIAALRTLQPDLPILVGGALFTAIEGLWKDIGADTFASDADSAVAFGQSLISAK